MLTSPTPSSSPSRITSSPSLSSEPFTVPTFEPQPSPDAEYHVPTPNESPLHAVHSHGNDEVDADVVHDTTEERQPEDSTAGITVSTTPINICTDRETRSTAGRVVYGRRSKEERKDKGKAIMTEPEPEKKSKKLLEQERLGLEEAIRLQEQADEEERAQVARDEEIARQLLALDEERATSEPKTTKDIDWNDSSVQKYWDLKNKPKSEAQATKNMIVYLKNQSNYKMKDFEGMSYDEIRPIFEKVWDFNHNFVPMDLEIEKEKKKPAEFQEIEEEQIEKDTSKKTTGKEEISFLEDEQEIRVPREDVAVNVDSLSYKVSNCGLEDLHFTSVVGVIQAGQRAGRSHSADCKNWNCQHKHTERISSKSRNEIKEARHLEEIHVTWAHLEKKQKRLRLYTKYLEEPRITERKDGVTSIKRRCRDLQSDDVKDFMVASEHSSLKEDLESSTW
ncbi:hypothetical protein Tco_0722563 [Tanacetum coccineum]